MESQLPIRVLIVDDEESYRLSLEIALKMTNRFTIEAVESGEQALETLKERDFDVVLLDHRMVGISGLEVLREMHEKNISTPVVMLTGAGSEELAVEAMKLGAYDYLSKEHISIERLPLTIANVFERYRYRQEWLRRERERQKEKERKADLQSLRMFQETVRSIGQFVDGNLMILIKNIDRAEEQVMRLSGSEESKEIKKAFETLRADFQLVSSGIKSMVDLSKLVAARMDHVQAIDEEKRDARQ